MNAELMNALKGEPKAIEALFKRAQKCNLFTKAAIPRKSMIYEMQGDDGKIIRAFHAEQEAFRKAAEGIEPNPGKYAVD
jgi:hypothetical protein